VRRWSRALMAAVAEANPRRQRHIGPSRAEQQRARRAEDRDLPPAYPCKQDCPGCVAARDADEFGRYPIGDCGPDCRRRAARREASHA
jgi:hypothetical protein